MVEINKVIIECNNFLKDSNITYAICGGFALELFLNRKLRSHGDIDTTVFTEDKQKIIEFILNKGWNIYEHKYDWIDHKVVNKYLRSITNTNDEHIPNLWQLWAIKPNCSFFVIEPQSGIENAFDYKITNTEQLNFDFFDITFNEQKDGHFIIDSFSSQKKNIARELNKAILYNDGIPYLAPEIIMLIISHPEYLKSDYHREKNISDFTSTIPFLPKDSKEWLVTALETAYPEGLERLEQLKNGEWQR